MTAQSLQKKIVLVVTDTRRRNLVFVSESLKALPIEEAIEETRSGNISGAHVVQGKSGAYLRTHPTVPKSEEFEAISITGRDILSYAHGSHAVSTPALSRYLELYRESLKEGEPVITPIGEEGVLTIVVKEKLTQHRSIIFQAAKEFVIDPHMIGAILIDEIARLGPFEELINALAGNIVGLNVSIGVAQVKIDTANDLIKKGVYHPNPEDKKLPFTRLSNIGRMRLYDYLIEPNHNIRFAAAFMRYVIDFWSSHIDLSKRADIIGTLYHRGYGEPKSDPKPDGRGKQISDEFYPLAKRWLST